MVFRILFLVGILWKWILWSSYFWKYYTLCSHLEKSVNGSILNSDRIQHNFINQIFPRPSWLCAFFISSLLFIASWTTQVLKIILRYLRLPWWLDGKNLPVMWETWVRSLGWDDPLEESMATHTNILAWRIPMDTGTWWATVRGVAWVRHHLRTKPPPSSQSCFLYNNYFCLLINVWTTKHNTGWIYVDIA